MELQTSIYDNPVLKGTFADNLQAVIDDTLPLLYGQSIWRQFLDWGPERTELTFDVLIGRSLLPSAASIIDIDAPTPLRSRGNLERFKGGIPAMGHKYKLNQQEYRAIVDTLERSLLPADKRDRLLNILFDDVTRAVAGTDVRLDIMFMQSVTSFSMDISTLGSPDGAATGILNLPYDPAQVHTVAKVWSDTTADPIADIDKVVNAAAAKGQTFSEIWIDRSKWLQIKNYTAIKNALLGYLNAGSNAKFVVTLDNVNEVLQANGLPPFRVWNVMKHIEEDGVQRSINPFDTNNVAFVQDNNLGTVENAWTIESKQQVPGVTYAKYDRTLLKKYRSHTPWAEWTEVLLNAIPAVDVAKLMLLQTDVAA